jgi:hypothetical protein
MFVRLRDKIFKIEKIDFIEVVGDAILVHIGEKNLSVEFESEEALQSAFDDLSRSLTGVDAGTALPRSEEHLESRTEEAEAGIDAESETEAAEGA